MAQAFRSLQKNPASCDIYQSGALPKVIKFKLICGGKWGGG
jgi:hypothetical protein